MLIDVTNPYSVINFIFVIATLSMVAFMMMLRIHAPKPKDRGYYIAMGISGVLTLTGAAIIILNRIVWFLHDYGYYSFLQ